MVRGDPADVVLEGLGFFLVHGSSPDKVNVRALNRGEGQPTSASRSCHYNSRLGCAATPSSALGYFKGVEELP